jgi:hypothetical protein
MIIINHLLKRKTMMMVCQIQMILKYKYTYNLRRRQYWVLKRKLKNLPSLKKRHRRSSHRQSSKSKLSSRTLQSHPSKNVHLRLATHLPRRELEQGTRHLLLI